VRVPDTTWTAVDDFFNAAFIEPDEALDAASAASEAAGLPPISVSAAQGKLLHLLARSIQARRILEIGTLGGYSTIWMARALPAEGRLITLEIDTRHAEVARSNIERAGLGGRVEVRLGRAADSLAALAAKGPAPFDLVFIDADKPSNRIYFDWALQLSHPGTVIVIDNVVRGGAVADPDSPNPDVAGVRSVVELIGSDPRIEATVVQTVGTKGYDGFVLAVVG
jgi:predicted O-methyltransferase YrrM